MSVKTMIICSILYVANSIGVMGVTLFTMCRGTNSRKVDICIIAWSIVTMILPALLTFLALMLNIARGI